ncbi:MAG TPA: hypothetical protein PLP39_04695 [Flavobacterium lutivivi]|nr:hypothetical protein [Flavobacterium lutivivi]
MKIQQIITELKNTKSEGFQLEKRNGILTSTWLIYKKKEFYYYFDINQKIEFTDDYKYSEDEILDEFKNANFEIELSIS